MKETVTTLQETLSAYDFNALIVGAVRYGHGHVNDTFCVYTQDENGDCKRYILQRISNKAFKNPGELMQNICGVTSFLKNIIQQQGGDTARQTMNVVSTIKGEPYYTDSEGRAWRMYDFVEGTVCLQKAHTPELFRESGRAFGNFQRLLSKYPAKELYETIEKFHDTKDRLRLFDLAVQADKCDRVKNIAAEMSFIDARRADCCVAVDALERGELPLRVTHNDTKLNNVLIDKATNEGICIIDLDTVMPGLSINDFGDSIRFGANHSAEDEQDLTKVNFDIDLFEVYTKGFLQGAGGALTDKELEYFPWGAKLMTLECGIRFLTDYLSGDTYFKTTRENHNLDRARTQFKLVADMEANFDKMHEIVNSCIK